MHISILAVGEERDYPTIAKYTMLFVMLKSYRADLSAPLCIMFSCVFVTFLYGILDQVCNLIASILIGAFRSTFRIKLVLILTPI